MERFRFNEGTSEGSRDTGMGESKGSVGVFWVEDWSSVGEGESVLDLFTGLREKRDFFEDLRVEGSIRGGGGDRDIGLASPS